mmetsp:Transcript_57699/g.137269  ORF Transcript_57699/g.137269 Transcript_57699/m.137269 type:complete len:617 (+) Transcript_57699:133-1983(+)
MAHVPLFGTSFSLMVLVYGVWCFFALLLPAVHICKALWRATSRMFFSWEAVRACHQCFLAAFKSRDAAQQALIQDLSDEQRRMRLQWLADLGTLVGSPVITLFFAMSLLRNGAGTLPLAMHLQQFTLVPVQAMATYCYLRRGSISVTHFRLGYLMCLLRELPMLHAPQEAHSALTFEQGLMLSVSARVLLAIVAQDAYFVACVHPAMTAVYIGMDALGLMHEISRSYIIALTVINLVVCVEIVVVERGTQACIKAQLDAASSKQLSKAAHSLLSGMCDAVVHLSPDFDILEGHDRLVSFLLHYVNRDSRGSSTLANFRDVIFDDANKAAFQAFIAQPCDGFTQTAHISLIDGEGNPLRVQLFHAQAVDTDRKCVHIVGINDCCADERQAPSSAAAADAVENLLQQRRFAPEVPLLPSSGLSSISEAAPTEFETALHSSLDTRKSTALAWVRPETMLLQSWTPAFVDLVGSSSVSTCTNLLNLVKESDRLRFLRSFQDITQDIFDDSEDGELNTSFEVCMHTQTMGFIKVNGELECASASQAEDDEELHEDEDIVNADAPLPLVCFKVKGVKRLRKKEAKKDSLSAATTAPARHADSARSVDQRLTLILPQCPKLSL